MEAAGSVMRKTAIVMFLAAIYLSVGDITDAIILGNYSNLIAVDEGFHTSVKDFFDGKDDFDVLACQYGHSAVVYQLMVGRSDLDAKDKYRDTSLI
ncbi:hypothetical protein BDW75DRAFT_243003 [Aspergillus navahoensis]